jgi:glycosyltransferase involved in cell wall biosynthesis
MTARSLAARLAWIAMRTYVGARTRAWPSNSRLFAVGERTSWSVDEDARHLEAAAQRLGYDVAPSGWARFAEGQAVFLTSHFEALQSRWLATSHRLATAYLHGRPGTPGYPEFDRAYETLRASPARFAAIQVSHAEMRDLVLTAGVEPSFVHLIRIGIDLQNVPIVDAGRRKAARVALGVPRDAFVAGSFQKDGVGWEAGLEPKLVKGPDVLVGALERVSAEVDDLYVLLTGPARGFVRRELERLGIAYTHVLARDRAELARAYHALDVYVVASRQEGGPKGALESMASGVPLVTTRVGQAQEIAVDGESALVVDVEDSEAIAHAVVRVRGDRALAASLVTAGRVTAERFGYERLDPAWDVLVRELVTGDA